MKTYEDIIELLVMEGPGLQDYVTDAELNQLIDGTLAPGIIADRYIEDLHDSDVVAVKTGDATTRADLLGWIRSELEIAEEQRREDRVDDTLGKLRAHAAAEARRQLVQRTHKMALIASARMDGATKDSIAKALGVSRPTLDKWIADYKAHRLP